MLDDLKTDSSDSEMRAQKLSAKALVSFAFLLPLVRGSGFLPKVRSLASVGESVGNHVWIAIGKNYSVK